MRPRERRRDLNRREHAGKRCCERGSLDSTTMRRVLISQNALPFVCCIPAMPIPNEAKGDAFDLDSQLGNVGVLPSELREGVYSLVTMTIVR